MKRTCIFAFSVFIALTVCAELFGYSRDFSGYTWIDDEDPPSILLDFTKKSAGKGNFSLTIEIEGDKITYKGSYETEDSLITLTASTEIVYCDGVTTTEDSNEQFFAEIGSEQELSLIVYIFPVSLHPKK